MIIIEAGVHPAANEDDFCYWLRTLGVKPERCYRVVIDGDTLTALCYAEDDDGRKYVIKDPKKNGYREAAVEEPMTIVIGEGELPASIADPVNQ